MPYELLVSTASSTILTSKMCPQCSFVLESRQFQMYLICIPMVGLDVILGTDWLSLNKVVLDCHAKTVSFPIEQPLVESYDLFVA